MRFNYKILGLVMFVMLICCVSAASATDVDNMTVPDDTDVIDVDVPVESVDDVEIDDSADDFESDDSVDNADSEQNLRGPDTGKVNGLPYTTYFNPTTGALTNNVVTTLNFTGNFNQKAFQNFQISRTLTLDVNGATFNNVGFDLLASDLTLNGATFVMDAPEDEDCILINVNDADNSVISNNIITYTCNYENSACYNHVIRVVESEGVEVSGNTITAYLPLKDVDFNQPYPSIYTDLVAGVAVESSNDFVFENNKLYVNVSRNSTGYPTLDAFIIANSADAYIGNNTIVEIDNKTLPGNNNYLYAIDVYQCYGITIDNNTIRLESQGGSIIPGTNNGTGAAYGIQLTGGHTGVTISNNNINTSNNGPNCGIYSQNFIDRTELNIVGNTIYVEGNASSSHFWSLVTGMELGDDYAYVEGNTITVLNKAVFNTGDNVYGISYSQWCPRDHTYDIYDNTINVINGDYAVYLLNAIDSRVEENCLDTTNYCCDNAVVIGSGSNNNVSDNYCTQCPNCPNCPGCP